MRYILGLITAYIVLFVLSMIQRKKHKQTRSLKKITIRTISDVSNLCAFGAAFWIAILIWFYYSEPENFYAERYLMINIPFSAIWFGMTFFGMLASIKGVWDICVDGNDVTVVKAFLFKKRWKISDISYCKMKRGGLNVYVNGRKRKAFFIDGMTDHFDNFIKRMEKEGIEIVVSKNSYPEIK